MNERSWNLTIEKIDMKGTVLALPLFCLMLIGCVTPQYPSYGNAHSYQQNTYVQSATYRTQPVRYVGGPLDNSNGAYQSQTVAYSTTSRSEVGSAFSKKLSAMKAKQAVAQQEAQRKVQLQTLKERERRINEFLWENEIPGVSDTRTLLKNTITDADKKLRSLADDLRLAGRSPNSDSSYVEILNKRNRLKANLNALDERIMNAIVSKSAGSAAEAVSFSASESTEMAAARANLQAAATQYRNDTERIIKSANW